MPHDPFQTLVLEGFEIIRSQMQGVINNMTAAKQTVPPKLDENYRKLCKLTADAAKYVEATREEGSTSSQHTPPGSEAP